MEPSEKLQKEIREQWQECENNEIMNHRGQFGENPDSFKIFTWSYIRATQNAVKLLKNLLSENRSLYSKDSVGEFEYAMQCELDEKLSDTGIEDKPGKNEVDALMNKLYDCGKLYRGDIPVGMLKDFWKRTLTEDDGILLTKILYGSVKAAGYNKRTRLVDIDYTHAFAEKETSFKIKDIKVVVTWVDSDDREDDDNVMDYVRFFISRKD